MTAVLKKYQMWIAPVLLVIFSVPYLLRDLWFDEALMVLNFVLLPSPLSIYLNYNIPNNHIVHSIFLNWHLKLMPGSLLPVDLWLRLPSLIFAVLLLVLLYRRFRTFLGGMTAVICLSALAVSPPFLVYATAVRGYMTGALLCTLALFSALEYARSGKSNDLWPFAGFSFLAAGVAPSNLAALMAAALYAIGSLPPEKFLRNRKSWILLLTPPLGTLLFYLPIREKLCRNAALGEGWQDGTAALMVVIAAVVVTFAMLLLPAAAGTLLRFKAIKRRMPMPLFRAAIWLLPVPAMLLLKVAPFPRVFLPLWPFFFILLAASLRHLTPCFCRMQKRWNSKVWQGALLAAVIIWGVVINMVPFRLLHSEAFGGASGDDFFYGYYLRPDHQPRITAHQVLELTGGKADPVIYLSFASDPWPIMFYWQTGGGGNADFRFDGPAGRVKMLPENALVILSRGENTSDLEKRFNGRLTEVQSNPDNIIYRFNH